MCFFLPIRIDPQNNTLKKSPPHPILGSRTIPQIYLCVCVFSSRVNSPKNTAFTRTLSESSREIFPASLRHESETQQNFCSDKACSEELFIWGGFLGDAAFLLTIGSFLLTVEFFTYSSVFLLTVGRCF